MLTKSATLMPAADLPPSEARGHYHGGLAHKNEALVSNSTDDLPPSGARGRYRGLLTKSATLMPAADLPPSEARGRYRGLLTKSKRAGTRQKRKSKIWHVRSQPNRAQAHARKEKARLDVCGAIPTGHKYTPEKKKQDLTCAEPSPTGHKYTPEKKKQDLACAEPSQ